MNEYFRAGVEWTFCCPCSGGPVDERYRARIVVPEPGGIDAAERELKARYPGSVTTRWIRGESGSESLWWFHNEECLRRDTAARQIGDVDLMRHFAWEDERARMQTDRLAWYMKSVPLSPRGRVLVLEPRKNGRDVPFVCVELSSKWYELYVIRPDGWVEAVQYDVLEPYAAKNGGGAHVDHVPNPDAVDSWAREMGYYVDDCSMDMMVGRWNVEVLAR